MKYKYYYRILTSILFIALVLPFANLSSHTYASNTGSSELVVSAELLYLREGPGLSYPVLLTLQQGQALTFIEQQDDWYHVQIGDKEGWVASWLTSKMDQEAETQNLNYIAISQVDHLNIRSAASLSAAILGQLNSGDEAQVLSQQNNWIQISFNGITGWVSTDYVSLNDLGQVTEQNSETETETETEIETETNTESEIYQATENNPDVFTVVVDAVNIRKEPDLSSKKIGSAFKDEQYQVVNRDNNWVQIESDNGDKGWIYSFYGTFSTKVSDVSENSSESKSNELNGAVTIIYNSTNLREEASTSSNIVTRANAGETFNIISTEGDWYEVEVNSNLTAFVASWVVTTTNTSVNTKQAEVERKKGTLKGVSIVIDPGHGGNDNGTTGIRGTLEKDVNLKTAELLTSKLRAAGADVYLTRESDEYVDLRKRVSISHQYNADAFISIHYDAIADSSVSGFTTYYMNSYQQELAQYVHAGLGEKVNLRDRGVQSGNYLVLRENRQNAILLELGYLSNPSEERVVATDYYREQATLGIYQGLLNYFDAQLEN